MASVAPNHQSGSSHDILSHSTSSRLSNVDDIGAEATLASSLSDEHQPRRPNSLAAVGSLRQPNDPLVNSLKGNCVQKCNHFSSLPAEVENNLKFPPPYGLFGLVLKLFLLQI